MGSKVGTKSIAQIAYSLRDPETGAWPTAMQVWRATYQISDGTLSIPSGEETLTKLHDVAVTHQEQISSAPMPMVEHFALVLGRKANHSRGVGIPAVNRVAEERIRLQAQIQASEQRAAEAQARIEAAEQRAQAMEGQVSIVVQSNAQLQEEQQSQHDEMNSLWDTQRSVEDQNAQVECLVKEKLDEHMAAYFARMNSNAVQINQDHAGHQD
uniref:Uncharacterized protein n=1 Tax=Arundo donax TaxID=35708 RepID=A0A0A9CZ80_ARUDO